MSEREQPLASASNALQLVSLLGLRGRVRVSEVAQELGVALSTSHRLLGTLCHWGFAVQVADRSYAQGPAFVRMSLARSASDSMRVMIRSHLGALASAVGETAHLAILDGTSARFVFSAEGGGGLRVASRAGAVFPAHCTSVGKALLAELGEDDVRQRYADAPSDPPGGPVQDVDELLDELAGVRARGFAMNVDESEPGISAVGVALHHRSGSAVGALSVSVPSVRFSLEKVPALVEALRSVGRRVEAVM